MKKVLFGLTLLTLILAACTPQAQPTQQSLLPNDGSDSNGSAYPNGGAYSNDSSYPSDSNANWTPAQQAAITALSQTLNLPLEQITLISTEAVEWPDGCLGVQRMGIMCTQMIVPGYKIILEANSHPYEVHTNKDGSAVVIVPDAADSSNLEQMLIKQLASNLGLKLTDVSVVSAANVEFADSCLGVAMQDVVCAQVITPGLIVVLESDGVQYEYHVSNDGKLIQPATLALTWKREGGIAGFCDSLTVFRSGEIYGNQCKSQPNGAMGTFTTLLSADDLDQFNVWMKKYGQVNVNASDPQGVSDRMVVELAFYGDGNGSMTKSDEQALQVWAQTVFPKLYS